MSAPKNCNKVVVDFVIKENDPEMAIIEDDIVQDLAKVGIDVNTRVVNASEYVRLEENGDYNLFFTRSWGAPYDPHTYLNAWDAPAHVEYSAAGNFTGPLTRDSLFGRIKSVQNELDDVTIRSQWKEILNDIHGEAFILPLWGTRVPYVLNRRFSGFTPSSQTYSYPIENVRILDENKRVTVAPGAGGAMFSSAGPLHPHQYFPNQLFTQAWLYEGLVSYGQDGQIQPCLATKWDTVDIPGAGQKLTFTLRESVKFHDGTDFNCDAVKLNFDHVLSDNASKRHSWMGSVKVMENWFCNDSGQFILETNAPFYPLLQELTYIRPLTIAAPSSFANGLDSHPELENSCNPGLRKWGDIEAVEDFNCAGLTDPIGTGPFKFHSRETNADGTEDTAVLFLRHDDYWGVKPDIEELELQNFKTTDDVEKALLSGDLDMALGLGPLTPMQVQNLKFYESDKVDVRHSDVLQHALLIMNTNKAPTWDINVRKAIIHAIDKGRFIESEFGGLEQPVNQELPRSAPYCDIDLNPKFDYDIDKALLLNCPETRTIIEQGDSSLPGGAIAGIVVAGVVTLCLLGFIMRMVQREKQGKPIFQKETRGEAA